jgi:nitronate monooxygenase
MSNPKFFESLSLPVIAAPMFLISGPKLVIECCKNGIVGTFPALNQRTTEGFEQWVVEIKTALKEFESETGKKAAPFGVNLIVHQTNPRVQADLAICIKHQVPLIITSLGAVPQLVGAVHSYGGMVFHDVIKKRHAEKAAEAGVDGLILVCAGAGGHAGILNPMPFVAEIKKFFKKQYYCQDVSVMVVMWPLHFKWEQISPIWVLALSIQKRVKHPKITEI